MAIYFNNPSLINAARYNEIGIEKECLRITENGRLSHTPHPFSEDDKNIGRDFCENQLEFISDVFTDSGKLIKQLENLHDRTYRVIEKSGELLWSFSNPPYVSGEDDILIAKFSEKKAKKESYRNYLAEKYGKMKMLFSGIHYNFSFSQEFIRLSGTEKNSIYLELAKKLVSYGWFIVYLMSASPLLDSSYIKYTALNETDRYRFSSVRCSEAGYWNDFIPVLSYNSIEEYTDSIQRYIDRGLLHSSAELYYPIRLKPKGVNNLGNLKKGINHIELRMLDLNPFSRVGITKEDIDFIHLFILWLSTLKDIDLNSSRQTTAVKNIRTAALYDDSSNTLNIDSKKVSTKSAAENILSLVKDFSEKYFPEFKEAVNVQLDKLNGGRYASLVREKFSGNFQTLGLRLAKENAKGAEIYV